MQLVDITTLTINKLYKILRKMAKSAKYQTLYSQSKEGCVSLFSNKADYTNFQVTFLQFLGFYSSLNVDIYMKEVDEIVLDNEIYEDAYQYYKTKTRKKDKQKLKKPTSKNKKLRNESKNNSTHVVFSRPRLKNRSKNG